MNVGGNQASLSSETDVLLADLLPVGLMLSTGRVIQRCNPAFAAMFGYTCDDLQGKSIEALYPSHREFIDIGDQWLQGFRDFGECSDERIMFAKGDVPIWFSVKGRCRDRDDPYSMVACAFESLRPASGVASRLTVREREIVMAIEEGFTSKEIATQLHLSYRTVETYRSRLMEKLQARNANHLLAIVRGDLATLSTARA